MLPSRTFAAFLIGGALCATSAQAGTGTCILNGMSPQQAAAVLTGTYGLVGQGTVNGSNYISWPAGSLTQEGILTFTQVAQAASAKQLTASYTLTVSQVSSTSGVSNYTLSGGVVINTSNCTAVLDDGNPYDRIPAFALTFINSGTAVVMAAAVPGIFVTYMSAQKE